MREIYFSFYHILIFIGIFQSLLLAYIFIFNKKFRKKANFSLAIALLFLSVAGFNEISQDLELQKQYTYLRYFPLADLSIVCLGFYYFICFLLNPNYQFNKKDYWLISPVVILYVLRIIIYFLLLAKPSFLVTHKKAFLVYNIFFNYLPILYFVIVLQSSLKKVNTYHDQLFNNYSEIGGKDLFWLKNLIYFLLIFSVFWFGVISSMFIFQSRGWAFYLIWIAACLMMIWLGYFVILRRDIFEIPVFEPINEQEIAKSLLSEKTDEHYTKLKKLMVTEKLYRDPQLNMDTLAQKTNLSNGYLSKIINQKEGKNFYDFVNTFRIKEVKAHLILPEYNHYSILGIGLEAGFKSKSTFNAVFKKMTGMTPSAYKKTIR